MVNKRYDAIVIGGGPGGYVAAIRLGQLKQQVLLVEKEHLGGVCLNWGCIPTKALVATSSLVDKIRRAKTFGITVDNLDVDLEKTQLWKQGVIRKLSSGVRSLVTSNGGEIVMGTARLIERDTIRVVKSDGAIETYIAAKAVVIATGARPIDVSGFEIDGETVLSAREATNLKRVPKELLIIGGGSIGMEMAMTYQRLGATVIVVEMMDQLLPGIDRDLVEVVGRRFMKAGGTALLSARATRCEIDRGRARVTVEDPSETRVIECDHVLVSVGFQPNSKGFGLEELGIETDEQGHLKTDRYLRTNLKTIYAIGDVSGPPYLAHKASKEGEIAAEVIAGKPAEKDWRAMPTTLFTDPEIAVVGLSEAEAKQRGLRVKIGKFPFIASGRALAIDQTEGFIKSIIDGDDGRILGVGIVGPEATDLIGEATVSIEMCAMADDIARTIHPHPTLSESLMESFKHSVGEAIHILNGR
ncbi:MAG: dihydrolipoyl dehydrogenase [Deltaproteobacteria bacterium]|nr:dihydrolipoyl dehydrogenase [Deltaproteobacteria bacterium]